jgi:hypothetical protein
MRQMRVLDVTIGAAVPTGGGAWISAVLSLAIAVCAAIGFRRLRGTTLSASAAWAVAAALGSAVVEASLAWQGADVDPMSASLWRYAAAVGSFCPLMGVLGAKRPQDRGWQWIVLSLWVILLVPAMQAVAARSAQQLELYGAWRLLLLALIAMGLLNYLPTRYVLAALLVAVGQTLLLWSHLFFVASGGEGLRVAGLGLILMAAIVVLLAASRTTQSVRAESLLSPTAAFNARWLAFRDGWGAFWALRVMQRVNQTAELSRWPVRLEWREGFVAANEATIDPSTAAHIQQTLDSLLRRFERL